MRVSVVKYHLITKPAGWEMTSTGREKLAFTVAPNVKVLAFGFNATTALGWSHINRPTSPTQRLLDCCLLHASFSISGPTTVRLPEVVMFRWLSGIEARANPAT